MLIFENCIQEGRKTYICIAPVSAVVDAQANGEYREIVNNSGMTAPDGMPDLMLRLKRNGKKVSCFKMSGLWLDLGRLEDLEIAQEVLEKNRRTILPK